jgi:hypothetical protein
MDELEMRVRAVAEATGVPFEVIECDPALADTAAFCEAYGYSTDISANTIAARPTRRCTRRAWCSPPHGST